MKRILWHGTAITCTGGRLYNSQCCSAALTFIPHYCSFVLQSAGFYAVLLLCRIIINQNSTYNKCINCARIRNVKAVGYVFFRFYIYTIYIGDPDPFFPITSRHHRRATWPWFAGIRIHMTAINLHPLSTRLRSLRRGLCGRSAPMRRHFEGVSFLPLLPFWNISPHPVAS